MVVAHGQSSKCTGLQIRLSTDACGIAGHSCAREPSCHHRLGREFVVHSLQLLLRQYTYARALGLHAGYPSRLASYEAYHLGARAVRLNGCLRLPTGRLRIYQLPWEFGLLRGRGHTSLYSGLIEWGH